MTPKSEAELLNAIMAAQQQLETVRAMFVAHTSAGGDSASIITGTRSLPLMARVAAKVVSDATGIDPSELLSHRRTEGVANARFVVYWLMRTKTTASLTQIAELIGQRDHGSISHGLNIVKHKYNTMPNYKAALDKISVDFDRAFQT